VTFLAAMRISHSYGIDMAKNHHEAAKIMILYDDDLWYNKNT